MDDVSCEMPVDEAQISCLCSLVKEKERESERVFAWLCRIEIERERDACEARCPDINQLCVLNNRSSLSH